MSASTRQVVAVWSMDEVTLPYGVVEVGDARCWGWTSVEFFGCVKWVVGCLRWARMLMVRVRLVVQEIVITLPKNHKCPLKEGGWKTTFRLK